MIFLLVCFSGKDAESLEREDEKMMRDVNQDVELDGKQDSDVTPSQSFQWMSPKKSKGNCVK